MATDRDMTLAQFQDLVDRLGGEPDQWPASERANAAALLTTSVPARQIVEEARILKTALAGSPIRAPEGLKQRILDTAFDSDCLTEIIRKSGSGNR